MFPNHLAANEFPIFVRTQLVRPYLEKSKPSNNQDVLFFWREFPAVSFFLAWNYLCSTGYFRFGQIFRFVFCTNERTARIRQNRPFCLMIIKAKRRCQISKGITAPLADIRFFNSRKFLQELKNKRYDQRSRCKPSPLPSMEIQ